VTFRRAGSLRIVLESLRQQTALPSLTVVADNDPDRSAEELVLSLRDGWPGELVYSAVGENLGPAGGWAHAVAAASRRGERRGRWVLVLDDDDPLTAPDLIESLLGVAAGSGSRLGGVGMRGARWDRRRARLERVEPAEGDNAQVHYLASGGAPLYSWSVIDEVGFFNPALFFGFEDLDFGFRLTSAGWSVIVAPRPSLHVVPNTSPSRSPWREYYKTRALVWILSQHAGWYARTVTVLRSVVSGGLRLAVIDRKPSLARARLLGAWDGSNGRLGARRYTPTTNPPKSQFLTGQP
jgi:GT2 family glycosyltransferase